MLKEIENLWETCIHLNEIGMDIDRLLEENEIKLLSLLETEAKLDDLVFFCNNGRYPDEEEDDGTILYNYELYS